MSGTLWVSVTVWAAAEGAPHAIASVLAHARGAIELSATSLVFYKRLPSGTPATAITIRRRCQLGGVCVPFGSDFHFTRQVSQQIRDWRLIDVRGVSVEGWHEVPPAVGWWLRQGDSSCPLALEFIAPTETVSLPHDACGAAVLTLTLRDCFRDGAALDVTENAPALTNTCAVFLHMHRPGP